MWRVLAKCTFSGQVHYQVMWQPTFMLMSKIEEYRKTQYTYDSPERVTQFGAQAAKWLQLVAWKASWDPIAQESVCQHAHLEMDILAVEAGELQQAARRPWPNSCNSCELTLSNIERQFFIYPQECQLQE